jgi:broad-specificity NMP kinase
MDPLRTLRTEPNIIITGTPGVGKTSLAELVARNTGLTHLRVNDIVKERECHEGWDEGRACWVVDEDKVRFVCLLMEGQTGGGASALARAWPGR